MEENAIEKNKLGFFKKIYYSIKLEKYDEMSEDGLKKGLNYLIKIVAIIAILLALLASIDVMKMIKNGSDYIQDNIQNVTFKNYELTSDNEYMLNDEKITKLFNYEVIINTDINNEEAYEKYKNIDSNFNMVVLLKNNFIIINKESKDLEEYTYTDSLNNLGIENEKEYGKQDVINYFNKSSIATYIMEYFVLYFVSYFLIFVFNVIVVAIIGYMIKSILKVKMTKHKLGEYAIYSLTTSTIVFLIYLIVNYFTKFGIDYFEIITLIIGLIYMFIAIKQYKKKSNQLAEKSVVEIKPEDAKVIENKEVQINENIVKDKEENQDKNDDNIEK